jgi:hypothetical protein
VIPVLVFAACADESSVTGPTVSIAVAPLTLPGVVGVEYALAVFNASPSPAFSFAPDGSAATNLTSLVWNQSSITSNQYGDGKGAITYVGTCDASGQAPRMNHVALAIKQINAGANGGSLDGTSPAAFVGTDNILDDQLTSSDEAPDFNNPCPRGAPCVLAVPCEENRDTAVTFNLTIMRRADQGFFDIAVNFEDIFCSAKLDCQYTTGPIQLLHNPNKPGQPRDQTAVLAFACTTGAGDVADTRLHLSPITVTCGANAPIVLDPTVGPGNAWTSSTPDPDAADAIWQYATYLGTENLLCDGLPCNKLYWNVALGFDATVGDCRLSASATAATRDVMNDGLTPAGTTYPWLRYEVDLTNEQGGLACDQHPLDGGDGVTTEYTLVSAPKRFCHRFDGGVATTLNDPACRAPTGYFATPRPRLHEMLEAVEPGYCVPSAADAQVVGVVASWAVEVRGFYQQPESAVPVLGASLTTPITRGAFGLALASHYRGLATNPEAFGLATADIPDLYETLVITDACEEIGRIAGLSEVFIGVARQPEVRDQMLAFTDFAGNLAAQADPKVVLVRADTVASVINGGARQPELVSTLEDDAYSLLGGYVTPVGAGAANAAMLSMVAPTQAVLDGIARNPELGPRLVQMAQFLMSTPVALTGTVGSWVEAELLAAYEAALDIQPEAEALLRQALLTLSGLVPPSGPVE